MLQQCIKNEVLEFCHKSYWNSWFLVKKKNNKYYIVNAAMKINKIIIQNANLLSSVDEFSEKFADCQVITLIDFLLKYD